MWPQGIVSLLGDKSCRPRIRRIGTSQEGKHPTNCTKCISQTYPTFILH